MAMVVVSNSCPAHDNSTGILYEGAWVLMMTGKKVVETKKYLDPGLGSASHEILRFLWLNQIQRLGGSSFESYESCPWSMKIILDVRFTYMAVWKLIANCHQRLLDNDTIS